MKAGWEQRADQQRAPPGEAGGGAFSIALGEAMAVVVQMGGLNGMHASQHENTQGEEDEVLHPAREADAVVLCSMRKAEACEKKVKRSECAGNELTSRIQPN